MTQPAIPPPEPAVPPDLGAAETAFAAAVLAAFTVWLTQVAAAVFAVHLRFGLSPDPIGLWTTVIAWQHHVDRFMKDLAQIAHKGWMDAVQQLGVQIRFDIGDAVLSEQLHRTRNLLVRIPDEVYRMIITSLAANRSQAVDRQAERIRNILSITGSENWPARAQTIAVTEVNRAYAFGYFAAGLRIRQHLGDMGMTKTWDAKEDSAVRAAHAKADGQTVELGQPFRVGGEMLMMPLDPTASPSNVINCRCRARIRGSKT